MQAIIFLLIGGLLGLLIRLSPFSFVLLAVGFLCLLAAIPFGLSFVGALLYYVGVTLLGTYFGSLVRSLLPCSSGILADPGNHD